MLTTQERIFLSPLSNNQRTNTSNLSTPVRLFENFFLVSPERSPRHFKSSPLPQFSSPDLGDVSKRGRPKAAMINALITQGSSVESTIRCDKCNRVFPREKSLAAHMRTHTGEKPYTCDYPNCSKAFCQSGQLKTHQRLHSGEKPFICSAKDCKMRFTHSNRHCPNHPNLPLQRDDDIISTFLIDDSSPPLVKQWLSKYYSSRTPSSKLKQTNVHHSTTKRSLFHSELICEQENKTPPSILRSPISLTKNPYNLTLKQSKTKKAKFTRLKGTSQPFKNHTPSKNGSCSSSSGDESISSPHQPLPLPQDTLEGAKALLQLSKGFIF